MKITNHKNNNPPKTMPLLRKDIAHYNPIRGCGLCEAVSNARAKAQASLTLRRNSPNSLVHAYIHL